MSQHPRPLREPGLERQARVSFHLVESAARLSPAHTQKPLYSSDTKGALFHQLHNLLPKVTFLQRPPSQPGLLIT